MHITAARGTDDPVLRRLHLACHAKLMAELERTAWQRFKDDPVPFFICLFVVAAVVTRIVL